MSKINPMSIIISVIVIKNFNFHGYKINKNIKNHSYNLVIKNDGYNTDNEKLEHSNEDNITYKKCMNKVTRVLNKKGVQDLCDLNEKNEKFSEHLANYIRNKLAPKGEQILAKRCNCITFNTLGYVFLDECFKPKDHSRNLFEVIAQYK